MEIRQLEHFLAVAEEENFTRAAARLHVVQSAISASIKALERELGVALFTRSSRAVSLTSEGAAMLAPARKTLAAVEETRDVAASFRGSVRGTVNVGLLATRDFLGIPDALASFRGRHPGVAVTARTSATGGLGLIQALLDETLDVSLVILPLPPHPDIEFEPLVAGRFVLAVASDHPLASVEQLEPQDLDGQEFVMLPRGFSARMNLEGWLSSHGVRHRTTFEIADQALVTEYVRAGLGLGIVPEQDALAADDLRVLDVADFDVSWTAAIATKRGRYQSVALRAIIDELRGRSLAVVSKYPVMRAV